MFRQKDSIRLAALVGYLFLASSVVGSVVQTDSIQGNHVLVQPVSVMHADLVTHGPINIQSDKDFEVQGWPGSGVPNDPFIIENLSISSPYADGIVIRNTKVYFVVRNCELHVGNQNTGFHALISSNGMIENVTVINSPYGFSFESCSSYRLHEVYALSVDMDVCSLFLCTNITIQDASFDGGTGILIDRTTLVSLANVTTFGMTVGCSISASGDVHITDSEFRGLSYGGLFMWDVNEITILSCVFSDSFAYGLHCQDGLGVTIGNSVFSGCSRHGLLVAESEDAVVINNTVLNNRWSGIMLVNSVSCNLISNSIEGNLQSGVVLEDCNDSWVVQNVIVGHVESGISLLDNCTGCVVHMNQLRNNTVNAFDDGENQWDNGLARGNYYDNWYASGTYRVPGGHSVDHFPCNFEPPSVQSPPDLTMQVNDTSAAIVWLSSDIDPVAYTVIVDGAVIAYGQWDGSAIRFPLSNLTLGVHQAELILVDSLGQETHDVVFVTVIEYLPSGSGIDNPAYLSSIVAISAAAIIVEVAIVVIITRSRRMRVTLTVPDYSPSE